MSTTDLKNTIEQLVTLGYSYRSYRGRGYTAPTCVGLVTDDEYHTAWSLSRDLAELHAEGHLTDEEYAHASQVLAYSRQDSLGMGTILYWEQIPWVWEQPTLGEDEEDEEDEEDDSPLYETWYTGTAGDQNLIYVGEDEYEARVAAQAEVIRGWIWDTNSWDYHEDGRRTHVEEDGEFYEEGGEYTDVEWDDVVAYVQKTPVLLIHPDPEVSYEDVGRILWDLDYLVCTAVQTVDEARREWPNYVAVEVIRLTADGAQKVLGFDRKAAA